MLLRLIGASGMRTDPELVLEWLDGHSRAA